MKLIQTKRAVIVGIFIVIGMIILLAGIFTVGGKRKTFTKTIPVTAVFDNVNGLQAGNNVWFSGVKIGIVKKVDLIKNSEVQVMMNIEQKSQKFIHKDVKAKIASDGLIGNKIVVIYGGTPQSPIIEEGDLIAVEKPLNTEDMMTTLQANNRNLLAITSDFKLISRRLAEGQGTVGKLLTDDDLMKQLQATAATLQTASTNIRALTSNVSDYTAKLQTKGALANDLVTDTSFFKTLRASASQIQEASRNAKELTNNLKAVSYNLKDSSNVAGVLFNDKAAAANLKTTVENLQSGTKKFDEDMEALQHNFLFRGFFRKRAKQQKQTNQTSQNTVQRRE
ncbi:MAG TPA: MlaD family protein [Chitinophagaceae bacterium]|nr:MlaD family protein [Chitinophagaceae bacterium]